MNRCARVAVPLASVLLAACSPAVGQVTPNGALDEPVTLTAASYNATGRSGGDQLRHLAEVVSSLSHGSITLSAGPEPDSGRPDTSADTIAAVQAGRVDVAVVSARTFDTLGVTSFQSLQAPYLVTSNAHADRVLSDPIAERMLEGVQPLGLVGLGLAFDLLAYPGGYGTPVLDLTDYNGQAFQVRPSRANDMLAEALGARPDLRNGQEWENAVAAGEIRGSWGYFDGIGTIRGEVFTANAPAFLRANVVVANAKVFAGLPASQQQVLQDAAAQTRDWRSAQHRAPAAAAAAYCASGEGGIAIATPAQQQAVEGAALAVTKMLEQDAFNRDAISRIRELGSGVPPEPAPVACRTTPSAVPIPSLRPQGDQTVIDGVWRLSVDPQHLREAGATEDAVSNNSGTWTFTFAGGTYRYSEAHGRECTGRYTINGHDFLIVTREPIGCDQVLPLVFSRSGDTLTFQPSPEHPTGVPLSGADADLMTPDPDALRFMRGFFHDPLVRVGDAR